jgi:hypothetical protein
MSENEHFLARWSHRKREAMAADAEPPAEPAHAERSEPLTGSAAPANPEVDLSSLPPIEAIDAETDITAFLRRGIPQELSRTALRRAWTADPAIRDFVGLAENAWDFNDPNAMAGFGPLEPTAEKVGTLVQGVVGGRAMAAESARGSPAQAVEDGARPVRADAHGPDSAEGPSKAAESDEMVAAVEPPPGSVAPQPAACTEAAHGAKEEASVRRRTHGGALPR